MAAYKLNLATVRGCPTAKELQAALGQWESKGLGDGDEYGVASVLPTGDIARGVLLVRDYKTLGGMHDGHLEARRVEHVWQLPFVAWPDKELVATLAGGKGTLRRLADGLDAMAGLTLTPETGELDIFDSTRLLAGCVSRFQLRAAKLSDYFCDDQTGGPYTARFIDTAHGMEFIEQHREALVAVNVRWRGRIGKAGLKITAETCFAYSCQEDDQEAVKKLLMELAFCPSALTGR